MKCLNGYKWGISEMKKKIEIDLLLDEKYLSPTAIIDSDHEKIIEYVVASRSAPR